jgi:hypothetical protein
MNKGLPMPCSRLISCMTFVAAQRASSAESLASRLGDPDRGQHGVDQLGVLPDVAAGRAQLLRRVGDVLVHHVIKERPRLGVLPHAIEDEAALLGIAAGGDQPHVTRGAADHRPSSPRPQFNALRGRSVQGSMRVMQAVRLLPALIVAGEHGAPPDWRRDRSCHE